MSNEAYQAIVVTKPEAKVTPFQERVYIALMQIPKGRVSTYALLARYLSSAPRAVGGALRRNPYAPQVPCHRIVQADGLIGGFMGESHKAPSGVNCAMKRELLKSEGVLFDEKGLIVDRSKIWDGFEMV